jgi:galactokinase
VAWVLRQQGVASVQDSVRSGADLVICGEVPAGAGLSSSAALECAVALALLGLAGQEVSPDGYSSTASSPTSTSTTGPGSTDPGATDPGPGRIDVARWAHLAENDFVGAPTGVLDQMASMCCTDAHALFLDVRSGAAQQVRFDATSEGLQILVVDTRANHSHSESGYGDRRRGCEEAARLLGVPALRDVPMSELDDTLRSLPERLQPLVRHVVTENDRVLTTIALLRANRLHDIGRWLTSSHESLRDDYRVSAPELDVAVNAALEAGALGARMTGGGFGGSAIALVREDRRAVVERSVVAAFGRRSFSPPRLFTAAPAAGAGRDR